jgi:2-oxoglutarate dehydrogenase complex dihydrolipoamide succinyltransferase (E2) component
MKKEVIMPQMGESIAEGILSKWLKKEGEFVKIEEPLFEVSTDKIDTEIPSPATGYLAKILVKEGETVPINTVVAYIETEQEMEKEYKRDEEKELIIDDSKLEQDVSEIRRKRMSPAVRRLIKEYKLDIEKIIGTGEKGRVTVKDIYKYLEERKEKVIVGGHAEEVEKKEFIIKESKDELLDQKIEVVPMTAMRRKIAEHMVYSKRTSAHVTTVFEVDMSKVVKLRDDLKPIYEKEGVKLTYLPFVIMASAKALRAYPIVNSSVSGTDIIYKKEINIGIAVALEWGLVVPVIKNADMLNLLGIAKKVQDLSERARNKKLLPEEVLNGTFSITNPGVFGALMGTPIINQPQVAILGMGAIVKRVVVVNDAIAIRPMMYLSLSYDHRVIDGATADAFLANIKNTLENFSII